MLSKHRKLSAMHLYMPLFLTGIIALLLSACQKPPEYSYLEGETMGTSFHIRYQATSDIEESIIFDSINTRLAEVNHSMSTYQDDSIISTFNQSRKDTNTVIDKDFINVLKDSKIVYELSGGAFDPTVMPVIQLWGFGTEMRVDRLQSPPSLTEIEQTQALIGFEKVILTDNKLTKTIDDVSLDFSAIAKGYGVDVIAQVLQDYGITNYMVEIGGEVATSGVNANNQSWKIAIDAPILHSGITDRKSITIMQQPLTETTTKMHLATSGNYRNSIVFDDVRYSHTVNPHTGKPIVGGTPSVTVAAESVALADAWATALTALPFENALKLAEQQQIAALFVIDKDGQPTDDMKLNDWQIIETSKMQSFRQSN